MLMEGKQGIDLGKSRRLTYPAGRIKIKMGKRRAWVGGGRRDFAYLKKKFSWSLTGSFDVDRATVLRLSLLDYSMVKSKPLSHFPYQIYLRNAEIYHPIPMALLHLHSLSFSLDIICYSWSRIYTKHEFIHFDSRSVYMDGWLIHMWDREKRYRWHESWNETTRADVQVIYLRQKEKHQHTCVCSKGVLRR